MTAEQFYGHLGRLLPIRGKRNFRAVAAFVGNVRIRAKFAFEREKLETFILQRTVNRRFIFKVKKFFRDLEQGSVAHYLQSGGNKKLHKKTKSKRCGPKKRMWGSATSYPAYVKALFEKKDDRLDVGKTQCQEVSKRYLASVLNSSWIGDSFTPPPLEE